MLLSKFVPCSIIQCVKSRGIWDLGLLCLGFGLGLELCLLNLGGKYSIAGKAAEFANKKYKPHRQVPYTIYDEINN